jgi:hypothetical protein
VTYRSGVGTRALALIAGLTVAAVALPSHTALAGGRPYVFVQGAGAVPADGIEWENWIGTAESRDHSTESEWWTGPVIGVSERLELGVFAVLGQAYDPAAAANAGAFLDQLRTQLTWLPVDQGTWPVNVRVRGELGVPLNGEPITQTWLGVIASREFGPVDVTANGAGWLEWHGTHGNADHDLYGFAGAGSSIVVLPGLRAGGEAFFKRAARNQADHEYIAGPSLSYGHGRFWASSTNGLGLDDISPKRRVRLVLGVVL